MRVSPSGASGAKMLAVKGSELNLFPRPEDVPGDVLLTYSTNPNIHWSFAGGVLKLTGTDTVANYQALLRDIWF